MSCNSWISSGKRGEYATPWTECMTRPPAYRSSFPVLRFPIAHGEVELHLYGAMHPQVSTA